MKRIFSTIAVCLSALVCFMASASINETANQDFNARKAQKELAPYFSAVEKISNPEVLNAMKFLYAYMPEPDIADYSVDFYRMNVEYALKARNEMPWGKLIPEREFYHFVLPVRINNENLDESRKVFFEELKNRVKGLSMLDAALEINHWCHEKVTYRASDSRTSSPLASVRTAFGRCGEESTFGVAAMRAMGIPARQVYTPRWAHTDDNHAWVEVFVDGKWQFLGACEPEPVLNLGWFNAPASRGMLMHTKAFGKYNGPEDVMMKTNCFTEINITQNYAPVNRVDITVIDRSGAPIPEAKVEFKVYNYGELYTVCTKKADKDGKTYVIGGLGDLVVWASDKNGNFGFTKASIGKDKKLVVIADKDDSFTGVVNIDLVPPVEGNNMPPVTKEQAALNEVRKVKEDSIRGAYEATFATEAQARQAAKAAGVDADKFWKFVQESRGNHKTILDFIKKATDKNKAMTLLGVISQKDRRDVSLEVLLDHLKNTPACKAGTNEKLYARYVLNPRIINEMITPYKAFFAKALDTKKYASDPVAWAEWVRTNIKTDADWNPQNLRMSPKAVWNVRLTDPASRDIFYVATCRAMGIVARIDEVTEKVQWADAEGKWHDVQFEQAEQTVHPQGTLRADYVKTGRLDNPAYYMHFTISSLKNGEITLLNFPEFGGWDKLLKNGTSLDAGHYLLTSGTRLANGSVLCQLNFLPVSAHSTTDTRLTMRTEDTSIKVIGNFNSENHYYDLASKTEKSILSTTGRGYYIIALINPNHEPTNHTLKDMAPFAAELEKWGGKILLLLADTTAAERLNYAYFNDLPKTVVFGTDIDGKIAKEMKENMNLATDERPIFLIADTFNRVVFVSQGYTIGLGEQLMKVIDNLDK